MIIPNEKDIEERLLLMFRGKLVEMWEESPPPVSPEGMYDTAHRIRNARRWVDYIERMGGRILDWKGALRGRLGNGILMHNPGEHPADFDKAGASPRYIFLPEELALRILVLGEMP